MDLFEAIEKRRSVRKFLNTPFPEASVQKALEAACLAPNSSNTQTWDFLWAKNPDIKNKLVEACLSQSAARTAAHLVVVTANHRLWRRSQKKLIEWAESSKAHPSVVQYYKKIVPFMYVSGIFNILAPVKWLISFTMGIFKPMMRKPITIRDSQEVAIKSAALASENFVLAITALGGATCMMEGFDECRVRRTLKLSCSHRVVMVIAVGYADEKGIWGPRFRLPNAEVIHVYE